MGQPINRARGAPDRVIQKIPLQKSCAQCARYERSLIDLGISQDTIDLDQRQRAKIF
jgi:glutaredoxin